ncbi:hypothetical protein HDZ31DRAFT_75343 [Schizophyllum fasciatum]
MLTLPRLCLQETIPSEDLIVRLEAVLSELIMNRLPEIKRELGELVARTQRRLSDLPSPPPDHPFLEINHQLGAFCVEIQACVDGKSSPAGKIALQRFAHFEDGGESFTMAPSTRFSFNTSSKQVERVARPVYIDEVYGKAQDERVRELPGMMSFDVYMHYIKEFLEGWPEPTHELAKEVAADVNRIDTVRRRSAETLAALDELLDRAQMPHTLLEAQYTFYREGLEQYYCQAYESEPDPALAVAAGAITTKTPPPATLLPTPNSLPLTPGSQQATAFPPTSKSGFTFGKSKIADPAPVKENMEMAKQASSFFGAKPAASRHMSTAAGEKTTPTMNSGTCPSTAPSSFGSASAFKVTPMNPGPFGAPAVPAPKLEVPPPAPNVFSAEMSTALGVMAHVRAYFGSAFSTESSRISGYLDNVHEIVDYKLVRGVARELLPDLCRGLGIDGPDAQKVCASLTAEREDVRVRREELRKKLERLEAASQELAMYR